MRGRMLWFNADKDRGQIDTEDGERLDVRGDGFASGAAPAGRCAGTPVTFAIAEGDERRIARDVAVVPEVAQRRARRRHGHR